MRLVRDLQDRFPNARLIGGDEAFEQLVAKVVGFVEAPAQGLDLPLDIRGTAFQQRVWEALRDIPAGRPASYTEIARRIGAPKAVRAVAQACASNALAVAIPCHRVVRTDGAALGLSLGRRAQARSAGAGGESMTPRTVRRTRAGTMLRAFARHRSRRSTGRGSPATSMRMAARRAGPLLSARSNAPTLAQLYATDAPFRSRVVMARHGFGRGEYKYFAYPLPEPVAALRDGALSAARGDRQPLERGDGDRSRAIRASTRPISRAATRRARRKPTPLLLQYGAGDYNCLHQDLYGEHVFPLQVDRCCCRSRARISPAASSC